MKEEKVQTEAKLRKLEEEYKRREDERLKEAERKTSVSVPKKMQQQKTATKPSYHTSFKTCKVNHCHSFISIVYKFGLECCWILVSISCFLGQIEVTYTFPLKVSNLQIEYTHWDIFLFILNILVISCRSERKNWRMR